MGRVIVDPSILGSRTVVISLGEVTEVVETGVDVLVDSWVEPNFFVGGVELFPEEEACID